jgi:hypothetical protein
MKEHSKFRSTKPLKSDNPGDVTVHTKNIKKPLMIHVDVYTKFMIGRILKDRTEDECTNAILQIKEAYVRNNYDLKQLVFDREAGIVSIEDKLPMNGIELKIKAAGQKVGLAEGSIRLVREKARATKAGLRAKFMGFGLNLFICLQTSST